MKRTVLRSALAILLAAVAVYDIAKAALLLAGVRTPAVTDQGPLFAGATVPMLLVPIVLGGSALLAAATVFARHKWGLVLAAAAGLVMLA